MSRDLVADGPLVVLDRAFALVRDAGLKRAARAWLGGAALAVAALAVYHLERVEGTHAYRPVLALGLVLGWWTRALLLSDEARAHVLRLWRWPAPPEAGHAVDVVRTASVVALGLSVWGWLFGAAAILSTWLAVLLLPVLALRGVLAPSWLVHARLERSAGLRAWLRAVGDAGGRRATAATVELLLLLGTMGLAVNLWLAAAFLSTIARSFFGFDVASIASFLSPGNTFVLLVVLALAAVGLEPVRAAVAAVLWADGAVRREGLDVRAAVEDVLERAERRGASPRAADVAARVASGLVLACSVLVGSNGLAQGAPPPATLEPWAGPPGEPGVEPPPPADGSDPAGTAMPPKRAVAIGPDGDERVREAVDAILASPEFRDIPEDDRAASILERIERWLRWLLSRPSEPPGSLPVPEPPARIAMPPPELFVALGAILALAALVAWIARHRRDRSSGPDVESGVVVETDPRDRPPEGHLDDAAAFAAAGRWLEALRALYLATLVALDRRGLLVLERGRTNGQYVRQLPAGALRDDFRDLTRTFDGRWYGRIAATAADYERCRRLAERVCGAGSADAPEARS
ncbi:MAG: DUF4129 domain-containing protein [Myxococcota bacterium]|nr:DUF4129 domain-containing protein [Myxococcota bacterium]MDW8363180.1 DUF4129 domain-containing protein [Myxococcales bacterium]